MGKKSRKEKTKKFYIRGTLREKGDCETVGGLEIKGKGASDHERERGEKFTGGLNQRKAKNFKGARSGGPNTAKN